MTRLLRTNKTNLNQCLRTSFASGCRPRLSCDVSTIRFLSAAISLNSSMALTAMEYLAKVLNNATNSVRVNRIDDGLSMENKIFNAVPNPVTCNLPHILHLSHDTQSIILEMFLKLDLNSSISFLLSLSAKSCFSSKKVLGQLFVSFRMARIIACTCSSSALSVVQYLYFRSQGVILVTALIMTA
jgi:hypothetical protein